MNVLLPLLKGNIVSGLAVECLSFFFFFPPQIFFISVLHILDILYLQVVGLQPHISYGTVLEQFHEKYAEHSSVNTEIIQKKIISSVIMSDGIAVHHQNFSTTADLRVWLMPQHIPAGVNSPHSQVIGQNVWLRIVLLKSQLTT